jgi:hypothetical protein
LQLPILFIRQIDSSIFSNILDSTNIPSIEKVYANDV